MISPWRLIFLFFLCVPQLANVVDVGGQSVRSQCVLSLHVSSLAKARSHRKLGESPAFSHDGGAPCGVGKVGWGRAGLGGERWGGRTGWLCLLLGGLARFGKMPSLQCGVLESSSQVEVCDPLPRFRVYIIYRQSGARGSHDHGNMGISSRKGGVTWGSRGGRAHQHSATTTRGLASPGQGVTGGREGVTCPCQHGD